VRQVIAGVKSAFVDAQYAKENLKLAQENLKGVEGVVSINEAPPHSGDLAQLELDRSRVAPLQYRIAVRQAELQLDQAKSRLQLLTGWRRKSADIDVSGEIQNDAAAPSASDLECLALSRRPDYLSYQQKQARSRADLRLQLANAKVDYVFGTEYTRQSAWGIAGNSLGLYFSMPLRVFNKNQGEIPRAQREISLNAARAEALETGIRTEGENGYRQYTVSKRLLASVETEMLAKARRVRGAPEYSYKRGEASLHDFGAAVSGC